MFTKQYKKKQIPIRIEPVTTQKTIQTLEGSQEILPGQFLATGIRSEQYAFERDVFDTYREVEWQAGYFVKKEEVVVEAVQLANPIEVFRPGWQHQGKAGDYFVTRDLNDQYVCDREIFEQSYEAL